MRNLTGYFRLLCYNSNKRIQTLRRLTMRKMTAKRIFSVFVLVFMILALTSCEACDRTMKTINSNIRGLEREITVYNNSGEIIFEGEGTIDVESTEYGNKVLFDLDGKRYAFYNCSVMIIEK